MRGFHSASILVAWGMPILMGCGRAGVGAESVPTGSVVHQPSAKLEALARRALDDRSVADELRGEGPLGLEALFMVAKAAGRLDSRLDPVIDRVAAQRYARYSGLYWHTELDEAVARAAAEDKPILSLRLLGDLRDDLSCANSRYFRVVLYPDARLGSYLRRAFVLHWSSERPVPKVTVDYGDGRKLVRTITGNSVHYVLDSQGRTVDAIPGLMAAGPFLQELGQAGQIANEVGTKSDADFATIVRARHAVREHDLLERWARELAAVGVTIDNRDPRALVAQNARLEADMKSVLDEPVPALYAADNAASKAIPEVRLLREVTPELTFSEQDVRRKSSLAVWSKVAEQHRGDVFLSENSRRLMRELAPRGFDIEGHAVPIDEQGFAALVERFQRVLALDTVRNRVDLRIGIHRRLAAHPLDSFDELNRWVYSTVFLTPRSDPWLGLTADRGFTAIPADGIVGAAH